MVSSNCGTRKKRSLPESVRRASHSKLTPCQKKLSCDKAGVKERRSASVLLTSLMIKLLRM